MIHGLIHSFISFHFIPFDAFIHSVIHSFSHSFPSFIHSVSQSFIHDFILIHGLIHAFIRFVIHSVIQSFIHFICLCIHVIYSFSHSRHSSHFISIMYSSIHSFHTSSFQFISIPFVSSQFIQAIFHLFIHSCIHSCVYFLNNSFFPSFQFLRINSFISIHSWQFIYFTHFTSFQFTSFQLIKNFCKQTDASSHGPFSKLPPRRVPGTDWYMDGSLPVLGVDFKFDQRRVWFGMVWGFYRRSQ